MGLISQFYTAGLYVFAAGIAGGLAAHWWARTSRWTPLLCYAALAGALLEACAAVGGLLHGSELAWSYPSGVPYLHYTVRLDPLASFFLLILSLLAASVSAYSAGYWKHSSGKTPAFSCALLNLLLLSLTLVFTASDVVFFLIAWEGMAVAAYLLVVTDHQKEEARKGGLLYVLMSRAGTGMLFIGFLLFASAVGTTDFRAMHAAGEKLSGAAGGLAFLLLFLGFGVKAGSFRCTSGFPPRTRSLPATSRH